MTPWQRLRLNCFLHFVESVIDRYGMTVRKVDLCPAITCRRKHSNQISIHADMLDTVGKVALKFYHFSHYVPLLIRAIITQTRESAPMRILLLGFQPYLDQAANGLGAGHIMRDCPSIDFRNQLSRHSSRYMRVSSTRRRSATTYFWGNLN